MKKFQMLLIFSAFLLAVVAFPVQAAWYNTDWTYRKNITFNSTRVAQNGLTDFPVLINISDSNLSSFAEPTGYDILFTDSDGTTKLDHEIENYTAGNLVAWVRIPTLNNNTNQTIYMYYNNSGVANQQNRTGVWNESYLGVWHLHEGAGTRANDSTRYDNNGTLTNGPTWNMTGQADGSMNFNGTDGLINLSSPATLDNVNSFTYTAWIYAKGYGEGGLGTIYTKDGFKELRMDIDDGFGTRITRATTSAAAFATLASLTLNKWQFVAATYTSGGTGPRLYVSAVEVSTYNLRQDGSGAITDDASGNGYIGNIAGASRTFNGTIDEVRVYNGTLSSAWMKTEYNNQFQPFTFHILGETNAVPTWYDTSWIYRKKIIFNSSRIAENGLTDFPVLINISESNLSTYARSDGNDILFTAGDGSSKLDHEIENYTNGNLVAWVRIPSLSNTTNTSIFMYYGNPSATNQQNRTGVWNASWLGVWHLLEGAGITANDSTRYNNNGTFGVAPSTPAWNTSAQIDGGLTYDSVNDNLSAGSATVLDNLPSFTATAWIRPRTIGENSRGRIFDKARTITPDDGWILLLSNADAGSNRQMTFIVSYTGGNGVNFQIRSATDRILLNTWQHVAGSFNGSTTANASAIYHNGTSAGVYFINTTGTRESDAAQNLLIGNDMTGVRTFDGNLDELRIYNGTLNPNQIRTEYNNQFQPFTFHILGETNAVPNTCVPPSNTNWTIEASDNCTISGRSINVTNVFIQGRAGTVIFRQTNVTATDCRIQPSVGALIMLAIEPTVNWGNGC